MAGHTRIVAIRVLQHIYASLTNSHPSSFHLLQPTAPTPRDHFTARVIRDTLEMTVIVYSIDSTMINRLLIINYLVIFNLFILI